MNIFIKITTYTLLMSPLLHINGSWANISLYQTSTVTPQTTYYTERFYNTTTSFDNFEEAREFNPYNTNSYGFQSYQTNTTNGWYDAYNTHESGYTTSYFGNHDNNTYYPYNNDNSNYGSPDQFDSLIQTSAKRYGVDPALIKAIIHTESDFNPYAQSHAGAQGLMQLMPATADRFGVYNVFDPQANIDAGTKYIAWLINRYAHNLSYALAGYNAGEGNVDKYNGIPPFKETQNYVNKVLNRYYNVYQNNRAIWYNN